MATTASPSANITDHSNNCSWYTDPAHNLTDADAPLKCKSYAWIIAVLVMVFAATTSNAGFNMQKLSQRQKKQGVKAWLAVWWGGMGLIAVAGVADFVALEFGDVTLVTPLGSLTLIANIFMANWFHGEKLYVRDGVCTGIILAGNIVTVVFAPHTNENFSMEQLWEILTGATFTTFVIVVLAIIFGVSGFAAYATNVLRRYGKDSAEYSRLERAHSITYPFVGGIYGSQSVTFTKSVLIILTATFSDTDGPLFVAVWQFWPLGILVVTCIVMQMFMMNIGLAKWDAMVIIPVFQSTWTIVSILSGAIVYNEFLAFNDCPSRGGDAICAGDFGLSWIFFFVGLLTSVTGVFLLSKRKSNQQPERDETHRHSVDSPNKHDEEESSAAYVSAGDGPTDADSTLEEAEEAESDEEKKKVTEFSSFKQKTVEPSAFAHASLSVRVVVVERSDTKQRWPFTVLMVTNLDGMEQTTSKAGSDDEDSDGTSTSSSLRVNDVVHRIDGEPVWVPHALDYEQLRQRIRSAKAVEVRRVSKIMFDKWSVLPPALCAPKGQPTCMDRLKSRLGRHLPWVLPVVALLEEESFDDVFAGMDLSASSPDASRLVEVGGGLLGSEVTMSGGGPNVRDDFGVNSHITWRRKHLCRLATYVLPVDSDSSSTDRVDSTRTTTVAMIEEDDDDATI